MVEAEVDVVGAVLDAALHVHVVRIDRRLEAAGSPPKTVTDDSVAWPS